MAKTIRLKVTIPVVVYLEGEGKLDRAQLTESIIEQVDELEEKFVESLINDQDEFEGSIGFGAVKVGPQNSR